MPGLTPRDMNGYADYGGPVRGGGGSQYMVNGGGPYGAFQDPRDDYYTRDGPYRRGREDPYGPEDPYYRGRGEEDIYRRVDRNGRQNDRFNDLPTGDQNSLADFAQHSSEPVFELDHLATYTAGARSGVINVEDGLHRLRKMENTTGIWTMRCILIVERRSLVVLDKSTGEELERFPMECVVEPTAVFKNDRREVYNNLLLFTVVDDPRRKNGHGDLHIFQSIRVNSQEIVDELMAAKDGRGRISQGIYTNTTSVVNNTSSFVNNTTTVVHRIPPPPLQPAPEPPGRRYDPYNFSGMRETIDPRYAGPGRTQRPLLHDSGQNEVLEKDVQLLNHCFDDIERFVSRLQQAAEAYKELERRKRERGNRSKKKFSGDGMLSHRARPPPARDFIDIFQKFKFSFNLLAKLKAHIHDPNAPELVHFLFTPLSLIYEASRDPFHGNRDLADQAVSPAISTEAKQLLLNCLTSKEIELWQALGLRWTTSREEMRSSAPMYSPVFYDGWRPSPSVIDDSPAQVPLETAVLAHHNQIMNRTHESDTRALVHERDLRYPEDDRSPYAERIIYEQRPSPRPPSPRPPSPPRQATNNVPLPMYQEYVEPPSMERNIQPRPEPPRGMGSSRESENAAYHEELKRSGVRIYKAAHDRQGKNQKEISVKKGDILQLLDDSRKWWKVRNYKGETGFAPYTILEPLNSGDSGFQPDTSRDRSSGNYNAFLLNDQSQAPPMPPPAPEVSRGRQPKRDDEYYYEDDLENTTPPSTVLDHSSSQQPSPRQRAPSPNERSAFQPLLPNGRPRSKEKTQQDILNDELREKMSAKGILQQSAVPPLHIRPQGANLYITRHSSAQEITDWLEAKGFSDRCINAFEGYTGQEIFQLKKRDFERFIGHDEASRLEGQLTLMKKTSGFETRGGSELRAILQRQKERADTGASDEATMGQPPSFRPDTPEDYDSDDSSNDPHLAETGKTLRDLLIRQRKKIMENNVFNNPDQDHDH